MGGCHVLSLPQRLPAVARFRGQKARSPPTLWGDRLLGCEDRVRLTKNKIQLTQSCQGRGRGLGLLRPQRCEPGREILLARVTATPLRSRARGPSAPVSHDPPPGTPRRNLPYRGAKPRPGRAAAPSRWAFAAGLRRAVRQGGAARERYLRGRCGTGVWVRATHAAPQEAGHLQRTCGHRPLRSAKIAYQEDARVDTTHGQAGPPALVRARICARPITPARCAPPAPPAPRRARNRRVLAGIRPTRQGDPAGTARQPPDAAPCRGQRARAAWRRASQPP